eukprot:TRINITY_DN2584_c0_g1_i1.p1 TRINITY_DN2584_c0_g1~~TRINITY_DN2584_c0_g1_i1.p1  ORF type:complete len:210 (+),score=35.04 TRINITY_DN2584_c0_g1_i1:55-684(+)
MKHQYLLYIIAFIALLGWILQVVALASDKGYVTGRGVECGMWADCASGGYSHCLDVSGVKAARAFGVLAVLCMSFTMIIHIAFAFGPTTKFIQKSSIVMKIVSYIQYIHIAAAIMNLISWACLAGVYDNHEDAICAASLDALDLGFSFAFLIIVMVFEIILAYLCWKDKHLPGGGASSDEGVGGQPENQHYAGGPVHQNPIDQHQFQQK